MKLHCNRAMLANGFQVVSAVVPSRTPKDILKNVKLEVIDHKATLVATDQEIGIRHRVEGVETESSGTALLPTARLLSILRETVSDTVDIEVTQDAVWVRFTGSEFRLSTEDPLEFPPVPEFTSDSFFRLSAASFRQMVRRTAFATDVESTRYALGGLQLELSEDVLTMAGTDSRRLAVARAALENVGKAELPAKNPVVPTKAMSVIERACGDDVEHVDIQIGDNEVKVRTGNSVIYSRLVEGRFPAYRDVIPNEGKVTVDLVVSPFHAAVRQAQIVTDEESRGVDFTFEEGTLTLNSSASDVGQSRVQMPISFDAEKISITFDPRYISEYLKVLPPEASIKLQLIDSEHAAVFRTDDDYVYVIMPLARDR